MHALLMRGKKRHLFCLGKKMWNIRSHSGNLGFGLSCLGGCEFCVLCRTGHHFELILDWLSVFCPLSKP